MDLKKKKKKKNVETQPFRVSDRNVKILTTESSSSNKIGSNLNDSNIFGAMEICSRHG